MTTVEINSTQTSDGEKAWLIYLEIERVIKEGGKHGMRSFSVDTAICRLRLAIIAKYQLDRPNLDHFHWIKIDPNRVKGMYLDTTDQMLKAEISQWEEGTPHYNYGGADFTGTLDGYATRTSLNILLQKDFGFNYAELSRMVNTTAQEAWALFKKIEETVKVQKDRVSATYPEKAKQMTRALDRLGKAILQKYQMERPKDQPPFLSKIDKVQPPKLWLYTIDTMLDAHIKLEGKSLLPNSLRETLDMGAYNLFNWFGGRYGTLWGKAKALELVEEELKI